MYWIGLQPGDVHVNVSSPGWAKHAWSSLFAPWNAEATVTVVNQPRFDAAGLLATLERVGVTSFCAPPTVWRMLVQQDLTAWRGRLPLREVVAAGEPLNPEVIEQVRRAWGLTVRDGFGQTETTAQVGNAPGQPVVLGSMGRPLPGYDVVLADPVSGEVRAEGPADGEICLRLDNPEFGPPLGLMVGYRDDADRTAEAMRGGVYHTGDVASRDADGYITYIGRADDVFKASDYRISPFELESVLVEHPAVAEAAVVPSPDPLRLAVPKAFVVLADRLGADGGDGEGDPRLLPGEPGALQADPASRVHRSPEDDLGQDPPGGAPGDRARAPPGRLRGARRAGVLGGRPALIMHFAARSRGDRDVHDRREVHDQREGW